MRKPHTQREHKSSPVPMLLRQLLTADQKEKPELKKKLRKILKDPRELLSCGILDAEHQLYRNAQTVDDALESITNGMEDPSILERLHEVPDDSLVGPWKQCVLALKALYAGDLKALNQAAERIPEGTPPRKLADLAVRITSESSEEIEGRAAQQFAEELLQSPDFVGSAGEQMEEALEMGMPDLFADTAVMLVRDLEREYPADSRDFALWCFSRLAAEDHSLMPLLKRFKGIFGEAETLRLAALGVVDEDADAALFFWLKYLTAALDEDALDVNLLAAALAIAADIGDQGTIPDGSDESGEYSPEDELLRQQFAKLLERAAEEIRLRFGGPDDLRLKTPSDCRTAANLLVEGAAGPESSARAFDTPQPERRKRDQTPVPSGEPQQLELFA